MYTYTWIFVPMMLHYYRTNQSSNVYGWIKIPIEKAWLVYENLCGRSLRRVVLISAIFRDPSMCQRCLSIFSPNFSLWYLPALLNYQYSTVMHSPNFMDNHSMLLIVLSEKSDWNRMTHGFRWREKERKKKEKKSQKRVRNKLNLIKRKDFSPVDVWYTCVD